MMMDKKLWLFRVIFAHANNLGCSQEYFFVGLRNYLGFYIFIQGIKIKRLCFVNIDSFWTLPFWGNWTKDDDVISKSLWAEKYGLWWQWEQKQKKLTN